jgi:hypothetical protein
MRGPDEFRGLESNQRLPPSKSGISPSTESPGIGPKLPGQESNLRRPPSESGFGTSTESPASASSSGGRIRTYTFLLNREAPYHSAPHRFFALTPGFGKRPFHRLDASPNASGPGAPRGDARPRGDSQLTVASSGIGALKPRETALRSLAIRGLFRKPGHCRDSPFDSSTIRDVAAIKWFARRGELF